MKNRPRYVLLVGVATLAVFAAGCTAVRLHRAAELAGTSVAFQQALPKATRRLLVVGDSTAVGTGASMPTASVAGLIARSHPDWSIVNRARDGATLADLPDQLATAQEADIILIMAGGNDVFRGIHRARAQAAIDDTLKRAHVLAPVVVCMPPGNVGNAPFFFPPWSWLMTRRARVLHAVVRDATATHGSLYVNLYQARADDPFAQAPARYHASDGLHPSDDGYALWYGQLRAQTGRLF